ncbi:hypothetical protein J5N97_030298, partial [Dioscorea zingiberensis]
GKVGQPLKLCLILIHSTGSLLQINKFLTISLVTGSYSRFILGFRVVFLMIFNEIWKFYCCFIWILSGIRYVVDAADRDSVPISESELHELLMKPSLSGIPLLVLGNKIDKSEALSKQALVDQLGLEHIKDREVCCHMISCKVSINIDIVIDRFIKHSRTTK